MGREIVVAWVGKPAGAYEELCEDYRGRIARHVAVRDVPIRPSRAGDEHRRLADESERILARLPDPCWLVALHRPGNAVSSPRLARWLGRRLEEYPHPLVFVVGSDLGLGTPVLEASRRRLSFGPMTLPHELARVVLYEQIYRSLSLLSGIKYHRGPL